MTTWSEPVPAAVESAFEAVRDSLREWSPSDDEALRLQLRALIDHMNDLHRSVDQRVAELGGEPVPQPDPSATTMGRVFQLNAIVGLPDTHELDAVEGRFAAALRNDTLLGAHVVWLGCGRLHDDDA